MTVVDVALYKCRPRHLVDLRVVVLPKLISIGEISAQIGGNEVRGA